MAYLKVNSTDFTVFSFFFLRHTSAFIQATTSTAASITHPQSVQSNNKKDSISCSAALFLKTYPSSLTMLQEGNAAKSKTEELDTIKYLAFDSNKWMPAITRLHGDICACTCLKTYEGKSLHSGAASRYNDTQLFMAPHH